MKNAVYFPAIFALMLISACGKSAPAALTTTQPSSESSLVGTWRMDCASDTDANTSQYNLFQYNADNTYQTLQYHYQASSSCDESKAYDRYDYYGTLATVSNTIKNITLKEERRAPLSSDSVQNYNSSENCNHADWKIAQPEDCDFSNEVFPGNLKVTYQVSGDSMTMTTCSNTTPRLQKCVTTHYQRVVD